MDDADRAGLAMYERVARERPQQLGRLTDAGYRERRESLRMDKARVEAQIKQPISDRYAQLLCVTLAFIDGEIMDLELLTNNVRRQAK